MIRAAGLGLALAVTVVLTVWFVVAEAPTDVLQVSAPPLVEPFPQVEALAPAPTRTLSPADARRVARQATNGLRSLCTDGVRRLDRPTQGITDGASVVVVEGVSKPRLLPGVVVDRIPGAPYGARTKVLRVTSEVREGDAGPVLDAKGRLVAVVFAVDPKTSLGVALPVSALRGQAAARTLDALDACDD